MKKTLAVAISLAMSCTACSTAWVSTLDSIMATAAPALINILEIVAVANGQPVNANLAAKISADAAVIKTLATDFGQATAGSAPGVCQQLQAAVGVYESDQQLVLQVAQVGDSNTQTKITLLANLVAGTASAIMAVIPSCSNMASDRGTRAASSAGISSFAARYNRILVTPTGDAAVDATTPKLKLHQHSLFLRSLTFGRLQ
jgi:hypothetical protein